MVISRLLAIGKFKYLCVLIAEQCGWLIMTDRNLVLTYLSNNKGEEQSS